jgi:hypothetical protein
MSDLSVLFHVGSRRVAEWILQTYPRFFEHGENVFIHLVTDMVPVTFTRILERVYHIPTRNVLWGENRGMDIGGSYRLWKHYRAVLQPRVLVLHTKGARPWLQALLDPLYAVWPNPPVEPDGAVIAACWARSIEVDYAFQQFWVDYIQHMHRTYPPPHTQTDFTGHTHLQRTSQHRARPFVGGTMYIAAVSVLDAFWYPWEISQITIPFNSYYTMDPAWCVYYYGHHLNLPIDITRVEEFFAQHPDAIYRNGIQMSYFEGYAIIPSSNRSLRDAMVENAMERCILQYASSIVGV